MKRRYYGQGKPGVPYIPAIPPQPAKDAVWDEYWCKWVAPGQLVQEVTEPPEYGDE